MGRDAPARSVTQARSRFNPRARMGRDVFSRDSNRKSPLFQSTRPYGARPHQGFVRAAQLQFQSTRPYGARRFPWAISSHQVGFQFTRPYGARPYGESLIATLSQFQSTRPYGARRVLAAEA